MANPKSLRAVVNEYRRIADEIQGETASSVFGSGNVDYMTGFDQLVRGLRDSAQAGTLQGQIPNLLEVLVVKEAPEVVEQAPTKSRVGYMPTMDAVKYVIGKLGKRNTTLSGPKTTGGVYFKIRTLAENKKVKVKKAGNKIRSVNVDDLIRATRIGEAPKVTETTNSSEVMKFDAYRALRNQGKNHETILSETGLDKERAAGFKGAYKRFPKPKKK